MKNKERYKVKKNEDKVQTGYSKSDVVLPKVSEYSVIDTDRGDFIICNIYDGNENPELIAQEISDALNGRCCGKGKDDSKTKRSKGLPMHII